MVGNQQGTTLAIIATLQAIQSPRNERDRDAAEWSAASDIASHPNDYAPKRFLFNPEDWERIHPWFNLPDEAIKFTANANPELFGRYRLAVLDYEGARAKQLEALAWSMRTLYRLRDREGANVARIDAAAEPIAEVLHSGWGVPDGFLALSLKRDWATGFTRRLDLLPVVWRHV